MQLRSVLSGTVFHSTRKWFITQCRWALAKNATFAEGPVWRSAKMRMTSLIASHSYQTFLTQPSKLMVPRQDGQPDYLFEPFFCAAFQFSFAGTDAPLHILWKTALECQKAGPFAEMVHAWENPAASDTNGRFSCCAADRISRSSHFSCAASALSTKSIGPLWAQTRP